MSWDSPHCVYKLLDGGKLLYVGLSKSPESRLKAHKASGKVPKTVRMEIIRWYKDIVVGSRYETFYIEKLTPPLNTRQAISLSEGLRRLRALHKVADTQEGKLGAHYDWHY